MKRRNKILSFLLTVVLLSGLLPTLAGVAAAGETNYVVNGDFETDADSDWKADNWTISSEIDPYAWVDTSGTKVLRIKGPGKAASGTISQNVKGIGGSRLPEGIYTLTAKVQGDPNEISSLKLFAKNTGTGDVTGENVASTTMSAAFYQVELENIKVTAGSVDIGLAVDTTGTVAQWAWALDIDDVTLCKTGEINYVVNGDFETDANSDWKADSWTASSEIDGYTWVDTSGTKVLRIKGQGKAASGTVSQAVTGLSGGSLPDGVYTLSAMVQGDPNEISSLKLFAKDTGTGDAVGENVVSTTMSAAFYQVELDNISVSSGNATVGLAVDLKGSVSAWSWALDIDNVMFYKTGELSGSQPTIVTVDAPQPVNTVVNQAPTLPSKVTAHLSNDSASDVAVTWATPDAALYTGADKIGTSFKVQGTVTDSVAANDIPVEITVNVTSKSFDLNSDSTVNVGDLAIASSCYGKKSGDSDWDNVKSADVNGDGKINATDLQLISDGILEK